MKSESFNIYDTHDFVKRGNQQLFPISLLSFYVLKIKILQTMKIIKLNTKTNCYLTDMKIFHNTNQHNNHPSHHDPKWMEQNRYKNVFFSFLFQNCDAFILLYLKYDYPLLKANHGRNCRLLYLIYVRPSLKAKQ